MGAINKRIYFDEFVKFESALKQTNDFYSKISEVTFRQGISRGSNGSLSFLRASKEAQIKPSVDLRTVKSLKMLSNTNLRKMRSLK